MVPPIHRSIMHQKLISTNMNGAPAAKNQLIHRISSMRWVVGKG